uniref:Uncharacterized protein n=1 Tax=Oryza meridionalis TaxID=40149 RepID=A0A0E0ERS5_9ORYZ
MSGIDARAGRPLPYLRHRREVLLQRLAGPQQLVRGGEGEGQGGGRQGQGTRSACDRVALEVGTEICDPVVVWVEALDRNISVTNLRESLRRLEGSALVIRMLGWIARGLVIG